MASLTVKLPKETMFPATRQSWHGNTWEHFLGVQDVKTSWVWKACLVEMIFVSLFVFSSIIISTGSKSQFSSPLLAIALFHLMLFGILIRAAVPPSDGLFNPAVTLAAIFTRMYTPVKGLMYIIAQSLGGILGALCANALLPADEVLDSHLAGCIHQNASSESGLTANQAFLSEFIFSFILLYIIFMVCLDPKQFQSIGLERVPLFVGMVTCFNIYVSGIIVSGYGGAAMNPARCLGPAVIHGGGELLSCLWIYCCAPALAAAVVAALYLGIPPGHRELTSKLADHEQTSRNKAFGKSTVPVDEEQPGLAADHGAQDARRSMKIKPVY